MTAPKTDPKADTKVEPRPADTKADAKVGTYRVTAPYITLKSRSDSGAQVVLGYFEGALVPETVDLEDLARHIRKGMVEKLDGAEAKAAEQQQADAKKAEEAAAPVDKEGAEAVKDAEDARLAAEKEAVKEDAAAKAEGRVVLKAADSPRGTKTAAKG